MDWRRKNITLLRSLRNSFCECLSYKHLAALRPGTYSPNFRDSTLVPHVAKRLNSHMQLIARFVVWSALLIIVLTTTLLKLTWTKYASPRRLTFNRRLLDPPWIR